jgi:phage terminase Nu1 subunit (DNA packaging protein)
VHAYLQTLRAAAKAKPGPDPEVAAAALDGRRERARLAKATADIRETELAQLRGELVAVRPLQVAMATMVTTVRNRILAVPPTARGQLPHLSVDDIETLEDMLAEALTELSRDRRLFGELGVDEHEADTDNEEDDDT